MNNIKQLHPKERVTLLAVKVPDGAYNFEVTNSPDGSLSMLEFYSDEAWDQYIDLPKGNWQLLGTPDQITEDVWSGIVEARWDYYKNYLTPKDGNVGNYNRLVCKTATESAISFLEANEVYAINPYGERPDGLDPMTWESESYEKDLELWQQAEDNTGTWVILLRV